MEVTNNVLGEKIAGLRELTEQQFEQNNTDHMAMIKRLDHTNGNVTDLQKFMWGIGGGLVILSIMVVPILIAYIKNHFKI